MNRFCEIRLVDVVEHNSRKRKHNQTKLSTDYKTLKAESHNRIVKSNNKPGNVSVLSKNYAGSFTNGDNNNCNIPQTRTKRKSKLSTKSVLKQDLLIPDMACRQTKIGNCLKKSLKIKNDAQYSNTIDRRSLKRKSSPETKEDVVPVLKQLHTIEIGTCSTTNDSRQANNDFNQEKKNKSRKRKSHKIYWESKLTGARRVSKRLTNLKMKNKSLERVQTCSNKHHAKDQKMITIISNVEKKIKTIKIRHNKCRKNKELKFKKLVLKTNMTKQPTNKVKHSHTKTLYPITAVNRRIPTSYRLKVKTRGTVLSNDLPDTKKPVNVFKEYAVSGNENTRKTKDEIVASTITYSVIKNDSEELHPATEENVQESELDSNTNHILQSEGSADNQCNELNSLQSIENADEISEQNVVCDVQEECVDSSHILIVDVESEGNMISEHAEEYGASYLSTGSEECSKAKLEKVPILEPVANIIKPLEIESGYAGSRTKQKDSLLLKTQLKTNEDCRTTERCDMLDDIFIQDSTDFKEVQATRMEVEGDKSNTTGEEAVVKEM